MDKRKQVYLGVGVLAVALLLVWRGGCRSSTTGEQRSGTPAYICVGCGRQFAEGDAEIDFDAAATGAECPSCEQNKLFVARRCPQCGHRYVPKAIWSPGVRREDDKCPNCGAPTFTKPPAKPKRPSPGELPDE